MYESDLPNPHAVDQELMLWKRKWSVVDSEDRPNTLAKAIKICDKIQYPNLFELLKIGCTLPVTSSECERSFSDEKVKSKHDYRKTRFTGNNEYPLQ